MKTSQLLCLMVGLVSLSPLSAADPQALTLPGSGQYRVSGQEPGKVSKFTVALTNKGTFQMGVSLGGDGFLLDGRWRKASSGALLLEPNKFGGVGAVQGSGLMALDAKGRPANVNLYFYYAEQKTTHTLSFNTK